jgi:hypothetical protein
MEHQIITQEPSLLRTEEKKTNQTTAQLIANKISMAPKILRMTIRLMMSLK